MFYHYGQRYLKHVKMYGKLLSHFTISKKPGQGIGLWFSGILYCDLGIYPRSPTLLYAKIRF